VVSEFLSLLATLLFLAMNGHLLIPVGVVGSFNLLPCSAAPFAAKGFSALLAWAAILFSAGLMLALAPDRRAPDRQHRARRPGRAWHRH